MSADHRLPTFSPTCPAFLLQRCLHASGLCPRCALDQECPHCNLSSLKAQVPSPTPPGSLPDYSSLPTREPSLGFLPHSGPAVTSLG